MSTEEHVMTLTESEIAYGERNQLIQYLANLPNWYKRSIVDMTGHGFVVTVFYEGGPVTSDFDLGFRCYLSWRDVKYGRWAGMLQGAVTRLGKLAGAPE